MDPQLFEDARESARLLDARLRRKVVPVRSAFITAPPGSGPPPLTTLLRGGRGGEVKLKLLLSMLWVGASNPHDVTLPARSWAELIGLVDPSNRGAARVNAATRRLVEQGFLGIERRAGMPSRLILQNELGTRKPYEHPGAAWEAARDADPQVRRHMPRYTNLPTVLWSEGWIAALGGAGLTMLLILFEASRGQSLTGLWFAPSVAQARWALNEATRKKGIDELERLGLVTVESAIVVRDRLSMQRRRNTYTVHEEVLAHGPADLLAASPSSRESRNAAKGASAPGTPPT